MNPHQAAAHFADTSHLGPADRLAAAVLVSEFRAQSRRIQYQREELRRLDAAIARRNERIEELEAALAAKPSGLSA